MLADFLNALTHVIARASVRRRFFEDPASVLAAFALSAEERRALVAIDRAALDRYATSLVEKRWHELARSVPLSLRVSERALRHAYVAWLAEHPSPPADTALDPGVFEGLRALAALRASLETKTHLCAFAGDLLAYELSRAASKQDGQERSLNASFAVHSIVADLERGVIPIDPAPQSTRYRFTEAGVQWR